MSFPTSLKQFRSYFQLNYWISPNDLLRDFVYRRLWTSILISSFGAQITLLALPLTAAILLHATPSQMGLLTFMEILPYVLLSLPSGVWLDRVKKLPVYIVGEVVIAISVASVPLAWWLGILTMPWLYIVGFLIGVVNTSAGTAAQIVLTQIVPRERLIEAHAKNALATSGSEVAGPASAGALIKLLSAPFALLADAILLLTSALILRKIHINEHKPTFEKGVFWRDLRIGLSFVFKQKILISLAIAVGTWQFFYNAALVVQILYASRILGLSEESIGLSYIGLGLGSIVGSIYGNRISRYIGPGPCMVLGFSISGLGWICLAFAPNNSLGIIIFAFMLMCFAIGGVLIFINFLALRQAVTPEHLLGRMTSTMRWLILLPAGPGALVGGWIGEWLSLQYTLGFAGIGCLILACWAWRNPIIRSITVLPQVSAHEPSDAHAPSSM
jgi:MFS family permease